MSKNNDSQNQPYTDSVAELIITPSGNVIPRDRTTEIDRLRADLATQRARADRAESMLEMAKQTAKQLNELRKIFVDNDWNPAERGTLAAMLFRGWRQSQTTQQWIRVCEGGAAVVAELTNIHRNTANNLIKRLEAAGFVDRVGANSTGLR